MKAKSEGHSHPEDARGGHAKSSQVGGNFENRTGHKHGESTFDERLPQPAKDEHGQIRPYPGGQKTLRCENGAKSKGPVDHLKTKGY